MNETLGLVRDMSDDAELAPLAANSVPRTEMSGRAYSRSSLAKRPFLASHDEQECDNAQHIVMGRCTRVPKTTATQPFATCTFRRLSAYVVYNDSA